MISAVVFNSKHLGQYPKFNIRLCSTYGFFATRSMLTSPFSFLISKSCSNQTIMVVVPDSIFFCSIFLSCELFSILNLVSIASRAIGGNGFWPCAVAELKV